MADESEAKGRPGAGAELAQSLAEAAARRPKQRDVRPLGHLLPFVRAHWRDAVAALFFLLLSTTATLSVTAAARTVVDRGFHEGTSAALNRTFILLGLVALGLALASALRFYFVTRLGERVVADLRQKLYGHILSLDPAFFVRMRTGEVLSRMTTDMTIVENM
ncbi:MAG TPA: ABC transporter transmembrane domain-containing protein, partial [Caulobacteraceae bacterium]|nr:ABC transporter transmembrane domain-containing protein [Caulobacteraceae bacterium]